MATTFGVTPQGFQRKTIEDILGEIEADERADIADDLDVSTASAVGQLNGIFARQLGIAWENLEVCYHGSDPDGSEGRLLEMVSKLTGTFRRGNTPSQVGLVCNLDEGTVLSANEAFAAIEDQPDIRWTPLATFTAASDGSHTVTFVSEQTGKIEGFAGTINVIATPITGWNSVVNPDDAELGLEVDKDPDLRQRREREIATIGSATVRAITANLWQTFVKDLQSLTVFENETDVPDANGLPPHSVEALIYDGEVPSIANNDIATVIMGSKAGGIRAFGTSSGNATVIINGVTTTKVVGFSRPAQLLVYLIVDLKKIVPGYVGDTVVNEYIATQANAMFSPGEEVIALAIRAMPLDLAGIKDVTSLRLGLSASPAGTINLPVTVRQIARFSTSRIIVNSTT